ISPEPFALGLTPAPASLVGAAHQWSATETHWLIREGIKMSGMPAWRYRLSDEEIWNVVAFLKILPTLSVADYAQWEAQLPAADKFAKASAQPKSRGLKPGDALAGRKALQQYLCVTCHVIPGVVGANQHVGPSLAGLATRKYIAGVL